MALSENIYNLTVRELRKRIREQTREVNARIFEYRLSGETHNILETEIEKLKTYSGVNPKNREIGVGLLNKRTKAQLQRQLAGLERFFNKDIYTPEAIEEQELLTQKQYETFKKRYTDESFTREDYTYFVDTMNVIKNTIQGYGYENYGKELAESYGKLDKNKRNKFADAVKKVVTKSKGAALTPEEIIDRVEQILK